MLTFSTFQGDKSYGYQGQWRLRCYKYKLVQLVISQQAVSNGSPLLQEVSLSAQVAARAARCHG